MADDTAIDLRDERECKDLGGAERVDDEVFGLDADLKVPKRRDRHLCDRGDIVVRLVPDRHVRRHDFVYLHSATHRANWSVPSAWGEKTAPVAWAN